MGSPARAPRRLPPPLAAALVSLLLLAAAPLPAGAALHPVDYLALQAVRRALADLPGSRFFASWDFTADPCGFAGVSCSASPDGGSRVVALALGDPRAGAPGLAGAFPSAALARLPKLASLSLVPGRVTGSLAPAVAALPALRFLALAGNLLSGPLPPAFAPGLRTLDLSRNAFSGALPPAPLRLRDLRTLVLSHNALAGGIPPVRAPLVHLDLRGNRLAGGVPPLPATLVYLSLAGNRLSGWRRPGQRRRVRALELRRAAAGYRRSAAAEGGELRSCHGFGGTGEESESDEREKGRTASELAVVASVASQNHSTSAPNHRKRA